MLIKPMAALIGGLLFAVVLGFIPKGCAHQPQPAKAARDYAPLIAQIADTTTAKMAAADQAARAAELEALKVYEQANYNAMRGVVYEPGSSK